MGYIPAWYTSVIFQNGTEFLPSSGRLYLDFDQTKYISEYILDTIGGIISWYVFVTFSCSTASKMICKKFTRKLFLDKRQITPESDELLLRFSSNLV